MLLPKNFVVHKPKDSMVIDYSETVNRFMSLDAYPFPDKEQLLDNAAKYHVFSKIDLKSAYHQVPLRPEDKKFTAFQVSVKLYQFTRLPFGATNAVAAFQRIMDDFVARNKLRGVFPYMDDVIVGGATTADHDRHLDAFMTAAKKEGLTLNKSKCAFGLRSLAMLGHVISAGSKQPDPDRFQSLFEYPVPDDTKKLRRLIDFFAYYAKWIFQYSVKIHPMLQALEQRAFPLSSVDSKQNSRVEE